jgi:membrane protein
MAAALAYYAVFSLPALLVITIAIAGAIFGAERVEDRVQEEISRLVGASAAEQVDVMRSNSGGAVSGNILKALLGVGTLVFGATGAFVQLQSSLNRIWEVAPDPKQGGVKAFILKRMLSFGMVLTVAFLLLVAMVVSAALAALGGYLGGLVESGFMRVLVQVANFGVSFALVAVLFALIFKVLPDAVARWRDVAVGAAATTALFVAGQVLMGLYFRFADVGEAFGAAGSLALVLVWIYYSAVIMFLGAEFTQLWAKRFGQQIMPEEGAVRVIEKQRPVTEPEAA